MIPETNTPVLVHGAVARIADLRFDEGTYEIRNSINDAVAWFNPEEVYLYILTEEQHSELCIVLEQLRELHEGEYQWNRYLVDGAVGYTYQRLLSKAEHLIHEIQVNCEWAAPLHR